MPKWINLIKRSLPLDYLPSHYYYTYTGGAYQLITRWADGRGFKSLLEVGCGSALACICVKLMHPWKRIGACDSSEEVVNYARERCKRWKAEVELRIADARDLPYDDGEWDSLLSEGLLEHYPEDDAIKMIREFDRVSKRQVMDVPINHRYPGIESGYGDEFLSGSPSYWRRLIKEAGLKIIEEFIRERRKDGTIVRWGCVCE